MNENLEMTMQQIFANHVFFLCEKLHCLKFRYTEVICFLEMHNCVWYLWYIHKLTCPSKPITGLELRINILFREKNNWQFFILMFYNIVYRILFFHHSTSFKSRHIDRHMDRLIILKHCREKLSFHNQDL